MSKQDTRPGFYTTWELKERGWSKRLVLRHFGEFQRYYPKEAVESIESTPSWQMASAEDSALAEAKRIVREDYQDRVETGELLSRAELRNRGWRELLISQHLPKHLRTPDYVAALELRLGIRRQRMVQEVRS